MKTLLAYYIFTLTIALTFIGCGKEDTATPAYTSPKVQQDSNTTQLLAPLRAPVGTSFAEDLIYYDIGDSNESSTTAHRANGYEDEQEEGETTSGEDENSDEDDAQDKSDGEDDDEESDDEGNDDGESSDDNENDDSSSTTTNSQSVANYHRYGGFNLSLNAKNYEFSIVYDKFHRVPDPLFAKQLDGTYIIKLTGYVLLSDEIITQDGVFSLELRVPSLNIDNKAFPISSNILTNSATTESVNALVTLKQATEGAKIYLNIVVPQFNVHNRTGDRVYSATFSVVLQTN